MRFCGTFPRLQDLSCTKERPEAHRMAGELVHAALLSIDDTDGVTAPETGLAQLGLRLEAVLVEVVARAPSRAQDEVALQVRALGQRSLQVVVRQAPATRSTSRASGSSRSASGEVSGSDTIEPSSK